MRKPFLAAELFETMAHHLGVVYVYEDAAPAAPAPTQPLTASDLSGLSQALLSALHQAAVRGDVDELQRLSQEVAVEDARLGRLLSALTRQLELEAILAATGRSQTEAKGP